MYPELDPALLAELRELHHSERAPAELERGVLERLLPALGKAPLGGRLRTWWSRALGSEGRLGWSVLVASLVVAVAGALHLGVRAFSGETSEVGPEPRFEATGEEREALRCPLDDLSPGVAYDPAQMDPDVAQAGLQLETFAMPIPGCPPLVRRALSYQPPGLRAGPLLIVLHDGGGSAEGVRARHALASFEARAALFGFMLVYANAAPAAGHSASSGVWQTDPGANRAIDDFAYLASIVERLNQRGLLYATNGRGPDVYLVGYGSGARLALEAAAQHPERYVGVAALLPDQLNRSRPPPRLANARLSRVFVAVLQDERPGLYWPGAPLTAAWISEWAAAIGLSAPAGRPPPANLGTDVEPLGSALDAPSLLARGIVPAGTRLFDAASPDRGGPFLRALVVQSKSALDVGPGAAPAPVDVATLVWEFFERGAPDYPGAAWPLQ